MTHGKLRGRPPFPDVLTPTEWRVAEAVRHGLTNPAIAKRLGVSVDAVKFHVANTLAKLGMASRTELRRWPGIAAASGLAASTKGTVSSLGPIGQIARSVTDLDASVIWYRDVLELPLLYRFDTLAFFDCDGTRLMLSCGEQTTESLLYFTVADIRTAHVWLAARQVAFVSAPHLIHRHADGTEAWMAFFRRSGATASRPHVDGGGSTTVELTTVISFVLAGRLACILCTMVVPSVFATEPRTAPTVGLAGHRLQQVGAGSALW